jgi:glycerol-3-phosphate dehydrogenase
MGEDFGGGLTRLEVDFLMDEEWAMSVEDLYWRHSKTGLYASSADECRLVAYLKSKTGGVTHGRARTG